MDNLNLLIIGVIGLVLGVVIGYVLVQVQLRRSEKSLKVKAEQIISKSQEEARNIQLQAKDRAIEIRQEAEQTAERRRSELNQDDDRLQKRRRELEGRTERLEQREISLNKRQSAIDKRSNEIDHLHKQALEQIQVSAQLSVDEARQILLTEAEKEARGDMARIIRQVETEAREEGDKRARKLIALAIQRVASEHVSEITSSVVPLPSDEMKGRIIGRNGRNIRAFEQSAGVDVIVDDTPEAVTISSFDPVRREVARRSMTKLVSDGRIHPAHIEKIIKREREDVERTIVEAGEEAVYEAGVTGVHGEIIKVLGRLKFRTSYGQNQLSHAVETSRLAGVIAAELGADVEISKAGGLLHDLGKAMDHNTEGTHAVIGADFAKRYGIHPKVVNAIASHHHEVEQECVEAVIVEAADAISGARPGARRESLEDYIKRVKSLEELGASFKGVEQCYALQAGREVRVIVKPKDIDDLESSRLARDIAKQIEETMQYPGQIKVTVIRETRSIDYAK